MIKEKINSYLVSPLETKKRYFNKIDRLFQTRKEVDTWSIGSG